MSHEGFIPLSNQLGITGSSYRIQLGKVNNKWATRLAKGKEVLDSKVFEDTEEPPNANKIVGWVLQVLVIPNINPYQIAKSVGFIRQEALRRSKEMQKKPAVSIKEAKEAKLDEIPEDAKARLKAREKKPGWVKEETATPVEKPKPKQEPESKQEAKPKKKEAATNVQAGDTARPQAEKQASSKKRKLPSIPMGNVPGKSASKSSAKRAESKGDGVFTVKVPKGTKKIIIEFED